MQLFGRMCGQLWLLPDGVVPCACVLQDKHHLYFLFDLMPGGDLMDVLVAEAKIIKHPVPQKGSLRQGCLSPKVCWQACEAAGGLHGLCLWVEGVRCYV